ncbi:MAG: STAS domain-containing protein [Prolixibacteraceae bacterium]
MNDFHIEIKKNVGERDRLVFSGVLTIDHTDEIKARLMQMVSTFSSSLNIIIEEVVEFDISFLQLLHSFMNLMKTREIDVTVSWLTDEEQTKLLRAAGFSKYL